jgi:hypothetical protein
MQISVISLYLIWSLISSSMNQIVNTTPVHQSQKCFFNIKYSTINNTMPDEFFTNNNTVSCNRQEKKSCGIKIEKPINMRYMELKLGCFDNKDCSTKKILSTDNITFTDAYKAFECCNGDLCNNQKVNLPITALVAGNSKEYEVDKTCPGFTDDHQQIYLSSESDNIVKIKPNDNLLIHYKNIAKSYIKRHARSLTWYAVFQDKDPQKEVKIASFSKDKQGKMIETYANSSLINKEKIFHITHDSMYLCNFTLKNLNIILNKIVTDDGHTILFGVVLTDRNVAPRAKGIIETIKSRHIIKSNQTPTKKILMNNHNNRATIGVLSNIIMLIPLIAVTDFN